MKNSTRRNIRRLTTTFGVTLLVALAVSGVTGIFRGPLTEAARSRESNIFVSGSSAPDEASRARIAEAFGNLPLSFEADKGQTDEKVKFLSRGSGYTLFLTSTEAVLALRSRRRRATSHRRQRAATGRKRVRAPAVMSFG